MNNYDNMTQKQLRPACKAAGIKYGKMNVTQMRQALTLTTSRKALEATGKATPAEMPLPTGNATVVNPQQSPQQRRAGSVVQNDIRQPGEGTKCRAVWDALEGIAGVDESTVTVGDARSLAKRNDWNVNNTVIEFYQWRKFHGFSGRVKAS